MNGLHAWDFKVLESQNLQDSRVQRSQLCQPSLCTLRFLSQL